MDPSDQPDTGIKQGFSNHFLIAMSDLEQDYFSGTLSYLVDHSDQGAFGLVINRPLNVLFSDLFTSLPGAEHCNLQVFDGGPVGRNNLFFLHSAEQTYQQTQRLTPAIRLTTSMDLVHAIIADQGPLKVMPFLGYAGWAAGQLEQELMADYWLMSPASAQVIFDTPDVDKAGAAAALLGINLTLMSRSAGHG